VVNEDVIGSSRQECNDCTRMAPLDMPAQPLSFPTQFNMPRIPPPVLPKFTLPPPFSIADLCLPAIIDDLLHRRTVSSVTRDLDGDILMRSTSALRESDCNSLPMRVEGYFHSTGNVFTYISKHVLAYDS
jgi:hypothetical protein